MASKSGISKSDGEFELAMKLFEGEAECKVTSFPSSPRVMKLGLVGNTRALSVVAGLLVVVVVVVIVVVVVFMVIRVVEFSSGG